MIVLYARTKDLPPRDAALRERLGCQYTLFVNRDFNAWFRRCQAINAAAQRIARPEPCVRLCKDCQAPISGPRAKKYCDDCAEAHHQESQRKQYRKKVKCAQPRCKQLIRRRGSGYCRSHWRAHR